ncbi:hypothetical protein ACEQ8H_007634 [Pleosporales sp. CAS-2024a]
MLMNKMLMNKMLIKTRSVFSIRMNSSSATVLFSRAATHCLWAIAHSADFIRAINACLVASFRMHDDSIGRCPVCWDALCERALEDRIETDRQAIFGSQGTKLHHDMGIEFPSRCQSVLVRSEEELAAAQLRLVKDYVHVHAEDFFHHQRQEFEAHHSTDADWYVEIIQPVMKLVKGWNLLSHQSRYFSDRDAFVELIAWAELVRLVNQSRLANSWNPRHAPASLSAVSDLNTGAFMGARDRYDAEKKTWSSNCGGALDCEKVAQDAYDLAVKSHVMANGA